MKTKTTYGMFGIVAFAAILSVSLIASGISTQTADAVAANKFAWTEDATTISASWSAGETAMTSSGTIGPLDIKSSDKNDWWIGFTGQCLTASEVKATGGKGKDKDHVDENNTSGAIAGATATLLLDGNPIGTVWGICEHDLQIEADLNALIEHSDTADCDDPLNPACNGLQFVCDEGDPLFLTDVCQQWVAVYSSVTGAYHAEWVVMNLPAGDHTFEIQIDVEANASGATAVELEQEPNGVESMVVVSNKIVTAQPVHIANPNS